MKTYAPTSEENEPNPQRHSEGIVAKIVG